MYGYLERNGLQPIDDLQIQLTEKFIVPNIEALTSGFLGIRVLLDALWRGEKIVHSAASKLQVLMQMVHKQKKMYTAKMSAEYPIGLCYPISFIAYDYICSCEINDEKSPFFVLRDFVEEGGVFKVIWGEVRHEYFQTALQIGSWYFDAANDTVDVHKPKVVSCAFSSAESEFFEVTSLSQYLRVKENYHECLIYRNTIFPKLAKIFPLLAVAKKDGKLSIEVSMHFADLMLSQSDSMAFVAELSLPSASVVQHIQDRVQPVAQRFQYAEWLELNNELEEVFCAAEYSAVEIRKAIKAAKYINFLI